MGPKESLDQRRREDLLLPKRKASGGEDPRTPGFRERLLALLLEAKARWERLSPEEKRRLLALLGALLSLLPWGRLGRIGALFQRATSPQAQLLLRLALRLLKR
jgi:type II secretory pathway component PulM